MGKLAKVVFLLAVLVVGVLVFVQYAGKSNDSSTEQAAATEPQNKSGGMQPQEKYGFAPAGE